MHRYGTKRYYRTQENRTDLSRERHVDQVAQLERVDLAVLSAKVRPHARDHCRLGFALLVGHCPLQHNTTNLLYCTVLRCAALKAIASHSTSWTLCCTYVDVGDGGHLVALPVRTRDKRVRPARSDNLPGAGSSARRGFNTIEYSLWHRHVVTGLWAEELARTPCAAASRRRCAGGTRHQRPPRRCSARSRRRPA